ncbi:hypothetical protein [Methanobrevibacter arboriphilus]|uniref:hypothetical protein n=1 Tax=Methanobrevibacter arboriphilus TaxID=39441 RepID=UPI000A990496|nr:hypothetical protein [Methanobrevibacter arboriphilus]
MEMESEKHKYCIYCGEKISADAEKCEHCGNWFERSSVSRNHIQNNYVSKDNLNKDNDLKKMKIVMIFILMILRINPSLFQNLIQLILIIKGIFLDIQIFFQ